VGVRVTVAVWVAVDRGVAVGGMGLAVNVALGAAVSVGRAVGAGVAVGARGGAAVQPTTSKSSKIAENSFFIRTPSFKM